MNRLSPLLKGVITAALMLGFTLFLHYGNIPPSSNLIYVLYALYGGGIIWTLLSYSRSEAYTGKFGDLFGQGFRCFIIVTLIMVVFTAVFSMMHPEFAEKDAELYRQFLIEKKEKTPSEIEDLVAASKKHYTTGLIYSSVFGYLLLGSLFTAAGAGGLMLMRRHT